MWVSDVPLWHWPVSLERKYTSCLRQKEQLQSASLLGHFCLPFLSYPYWRVIPYFPCLPCEARKLCADRGTWRGSEEACSPEAAQRSRTPQGTHRHPPGRARRGCRPPAPLPPGAARLPPSGVPAQGRAAGRRTAHFHRALSSGWGPLRSPASGAAAGAAAAVRAPPGRAPPRAPLRRCPLPVLKPPPAPPRPRRSASRPAAPGQRNRPPPPGSEFSPAGAGGIRGRKLCPPPPLLPPLQQARQKGKRRGNSHPAASDGSSSGNRLLGSRRGRKGRLWLTG